MKRITKIIFWDLQKHFEWHLKNFGVTEKKKEENLTILMLIFSHEAVKYQKVSLYIMYGLSFAFPTAFTLLPVSPRVAFFLVLKGVPSNPVTALDS